jgi:hypothetical protein
MDQRRYHAFGIDPLVISTDVLIREQIDGVAGPREPLLFQPESHALRAIGHSEMKEV